MEQKDKKLTIAEMTDTFYPIVNGVVTVVDKLTTALNKTDNAFVCTTRGGTKKGRTTKTFPYELYTCRGFFVPVQKDGWSCISLDRKFRKAVMAKDIDVIHCHTIFRQFVFAKKIAKKKHVPIIITVHTQSHYDFKKFLKFDCFVKSAMKKLVRTYNQADQIWALNEGVKQYLIGWGADESKIRIFGNACDIVVPDNRDELINKVNDLHGLAGQENVFLYAGRLMEYKNIFLIADSLKILKDKGVNFKMIYVGDGLDRPKLEQRIKDLGLEDNVIFTGMVTDRNMMIGYYLRADLFLFPSVYDTDGLVKAEAAICDTPSVMIEGSMAALGFKDRQDIYTCKEDAQSFADKVYEIINDKENFEFVKKNAKNALYKTWDQNAKRAVEMYKDAIKEYNEKHTSEKEHK